MYQVANSLKLVEEATDEIIREKMIDELGAIIDKNMAEIEAANYVTIEKMETELLG